MPARKLLPEQDREIIELYRAKTPVAEIIAAYNISQGGLYRVLERHGVPSNNFRDSRLGAPPPVERVVNGHVDKIEVDKTSTVQHVEPEVVDRRPTWVVRFHGEVIVHGDSVDQALIEARKLGIVRNISEVRRRD